MDQEIKKSFIFMMVNQTKNQGYWNKQVNSNAR